MLMNIGDKPVPSKNNLLTTVAWKINGKKPSMRWKDPFSIAGAVVQWLRDGLGVIRESRDVEYFCQQS